jgi:hypothetical protein
MDKILILKNINLVDSYSVNKKNKYLIDLLDKNKALPQQGSPEWHKTRSTAVGGSEMASVTGDNPFNKIKDLIARKLGLKKFNGNLYTLWGSLMEMITTMLIEKLFDVKIIELGSVEGCVPHQRYSPDGLANMILKCRHVINGQIFYKLEYLTILFEFKSPFSKIPNGSIPSHYLPQVLTGLCTFPDVDCALFVNNTYRKCGLSDFNFNSNYDKSFTEKDQFNLKKAKVEIKNPLSMGFLMFYMTNTQKTNFINKYYSDEEDLDILVNLQIDITLLNTGPFITRIHDIIKNTLDGESNQIDVGILNKKETQVIFQLCKDKELNVHYTDPIIFPSEYKNSDFLEVQLADAVNKTKSDLSNQKLIELYKNKIPEYSDKCSSKKRTFLGFMPWKLFIMDIIPQERKVGYVESYAPILKKTFETITLLKQNDNYQESYDKMFPPKELVLSDSDKKNINDYSNLF